MGDWEWHRSPNYYSENKYNTRVEYLIYFTYITNKFCTFHLLAYDKGMLIRRRIACISGIQGPQGPYRVHFVASA